METQMTTIRFPDDIYEELKKSAAQNHISINQMVVESVRQMLGDSTVKKLRWKAD